MDNQNCLIGCIVTTYEREETTELLLPKGTYYSFISPGAMQELSVVVKSQGLVDVSIFPCAGYSSGGEL